MSNIYGFSEASSSGANNDQSELDGYVTLDTDQVITGAKTFNNYTTFDDNIELSGTNTTLYSSNATQHLIIQGPPATSTYGVLISTNGGGSGAAISVVPTGVTTAQINLNQPTVINANLTTPTINNMYIAGTSTSVCVGKDNGNFISQTGVYNTQVGTSAGHSTTIGDHNTMIGDSAGYYNTSGNYNVCIGHNAAYYSGGSTQNKVVIANDMYDFQTNSNITVIGQNTFTQYQVGQFNWKTQTFYNSNPASGSYIYYINADFGVVPAVIFLRSAAAFGVFYLKLPTPTSNHKGCRFTFRWIQPGYKNDWYVQTDGGNYIVKEFNSPTNQYHLDNYFCASFLSDGIYWYSMEVMQ